MNDYTLGIEELDNAIEGIKSGSNILLIGPPMCGKEFILYHVMYHGSGINENAIINVTSRETATHILDWFSEKNLKLPLDRIGIIDCVTKPSSGEVVNNVNIKFVSSTVDLTGIGLKISQFLDEFVIENQSQKYKHFIRIVGLSAKPPPWFEYEIKGANLKILGPVSPPLTRTPN